jgi:spermidine synthase
MARALFVSVFLVATCGLAFELIAGALASYLLGDSVTQFSLVIGVYLGGMGLGSWLSRHLERDLVERFVEIEVAVALLGGFEAALLYAGFALTPAFRPLLFVLVSLVGIGVGLELPLLVRILETRTTLKELVARVLALDYVGALCASLLFPLVLVPHLGLLRSSLALGMVNASVALWTTFLFESGGVLRLRVYSAGALVLLALGLAGARAYEERIDAGLYAAPVVLSESTPYQRIVITGDGDETRLYLDGNLQFASLDEYRYHEALVHPAMAAARSPSSVLVLGGGDGLALREVLKWPSVRDVTLVDLDPAMVRLFRDRPELARLNAGAFSDPRVTAVSADAFTWLQAPSQAARRWDVEILDFPDPNHFALGKLYTTTMYAAARDHLAPGGTMSVQATSAYFSRDAFWCIVRTLRHVGMDARPYHAYVPSFGEWGFVLAGGAATFAALPPGLKFLDADTLPRLFDFPRDMEPVDVPVNRLDNQALVQIYEAEWRALELH